MLLALLSTTSSGLEKPGVHEPGIAGDSAVDSRGNLSALYSCMGPQLFKPAPSMHELQAERPSIIMH